MFESQQNVGRVTQRDLWEAEQRMSEQVFEGIRATGKVQLAIGYIFTPAHEQRQGDSWSSPAMVFVPAGTWRVFLHGTGNNDGPRQGLAVVEFKREFADSSSRWEVVVVQLADLLWAATP